MRKVILVIGGGVALGALLIFLIIGIGHFQSVGSAGSHGTTQKPVESTKPSDSGAGDDTKPTETDSNLIPDDWLDTEYPTGPWTEWEDDTDLPIDTEEPSDTEIPTESESESESESETQKPTQPAEPEKPKEIPYYIKVNRAANCVTIYAKDANGEYTVPYKSMICSVGTYYIDKNTQEIKGNTPLGKFKMPGTKYRWRKLFGPAGLNVYGYYTTRIVNHILFHSVPYTATNNTTLWEGQYNKLGSPASKGCIRLAVKDAKWIYDNCGEGTVVEIYDDIDNPGPLGRPDAIQIGAGSPFAGWDPTDPDTKNPWHTGNVTISGVTEVADIERGSMIEWDEYFINRGPEETDNVYATDVDGLRLPVYLNSDLDIHKAGMYNMVFTATGVTGKTDSKNIMVNVIDTIAPVLEIKAGTTMPLLITVDDGDSKADIVAKILEVLDAADVDAVGHKEMLNDENVVLDVSEVEAAIKSKIPGTYYFKAYAVDAVGNESAQQKFAIRYVRSDEQAPSITVDSNICTTVDLTGIADEAARKAALLDAAKKALVQGETYDISDDMSDISKITCSIEGDYAGETTGGSYTVDLVLRATDETGKESQVQVAVTVTVVDDSVPGQNSGEEDGAETENNSQLT